VTVESLDWEAEELQKELLLRMPLLLLLLVLEQLKVEVEVLSVAFAPMLLPMTAYWHRVLALLLWRQWWLQRLWGREDRGAGKEAVVAVAVVAGAALAPLVLRRLLLLLQLVLLQCLSLLL